MSLGIYDVKLFLSTLIIGFVIKIIDDYIDDDKSIIFKSNETGILPYTLIIFSLACLLDKSIAISYISSAYIVGMFNDFNRPLTFRLKGYQESIILVIINTLFLSFKEFFTSILIIFIIQLWDDIIDIKEDKYFRNRSFAIKFGVGEVFIFSLILLTISLDLKMKKTIIGLVTFFIFELIDNVYIEGEKI